VTIPPYRMPAGARRPTAWILGSATIEIWRKVQNGALEIAKKAAMEGGRALFSAPRCPSEPRSAVLVAVHRGFLPRWRSPLIGGAVGLAVGAAGTAANLGFARRFKGAAPASLSLVMTGVSFPGLGGTRRGLALTMGSHCAAVPRRARLTRRVLGGDGSFELPRQLPRIRLPYWSPGR